MYFAPQDAVQSFWHATAALLRPSIGDQVPQTLHWPQDYHAHWLQGDLLLSQACGYPLTHSLAGRVQLVGTFAYDVAGAEGIGCRSVLVCRVQDPRERLAHFAGSTLAYNETDSQSGYNALRALVAQTSDMRPFYGKSWATGSHGNSMEAVRTGSADMAAIDCVTWALWQRTNPEEASALRVFGHTEHYPGLPLITSLQTSETTLQALRTALATVAEAPDYAALRAPLLISGFAATTLQDYQPCLDMEAQAARLGLHTL